MVKPLKTSYTIHVEDADIAKAERSNSSHCVVAQAVAREIPDAARISVDLQSIKFSARGKRFNFLTPKPVAQYIVDFDAGDPIEPFSFRMRDPRITNSDAGRPRGQAAGAAVNGSPEHIAKVKATREAHKAEPNTLPMKQPDGEIVAQPVLHQRKGAPTAKSAKGKTRTYGSRLLRINQDRFTLKGEFAIDSPEMPVSPGV